MRPLKEQSCYILGVRFLDQNPDGLSAAELTVMLGIAKRNTLNYIKLWREEGKVRICDWRRADRPGDMTPVYGLVCFTGQKDKKKPDPITEKEKQARYRQKYGAIIRARRRLQRTGDAKHIRTLLDPIIRSNKGVKP